MRFNLEQSGLFTAAVVRLAQDRHEIIITTYHAICDGWSIGVLLEDVRAIYQAQTGQAGPTLMPVQSISQLSIAEGLRQAKFKAGPAC